MRRPLALKMLVGHSVGGDVTAGYVQMSTERLRSVAQKVTDRMKILCGIDDVIDANVARIR